MYRMTLAALLAASRAAAQNISVALDWTPNTNHAGLYVTQAQGWYEDAGLDVGILPYTDTASTTLVTSGVAEIGVFSALSFFTNRAAAADLVATFAVVQHETGRLVFNAGRDDIETPADLVGMTYAGFGTDWEEALISTMIEAADGKGEFEMVTLGTSAYEALASGRVDFTLEVATWEGVNAELTGRDQRAFVYADYGIPDQHTTLIGARADWLEANPETAEAFMQATQRGYRFAAENPDEAAEILIEAIEGMLSNPDLIRASMRALVEGDYLVVEDGTAGTIDPGKINAIGTFLYEAGILRDRDGQVLQEKPDFSSWFTNAFID